MPKWFHLPGRRAIGPLAMLWCRAAAATPEVLAHDARSAGIGATGVAFADDASATQHNPARLQAISHASFVVGLTVAAAHQEAPVLGPNQKSTSDIVAVFGMMGGAYRLTPRFVLGLSVLPASGSAGRYELPNGTEASAAVWTAEAQLAVSFALLDNLWLGVVYRPSYVRQDIKTPTSLADGSIFQSKTTLDTFNFVGASVGIYYEPIRGTGIGFAYRSRTSHSTSGTADTPQGSLPARSHVATPDKFNLGVAQRLLDDTLLVSIEGSLAMSPWIDSATTTTLDTPNGPISQVTVTNDRAYWEAKVGGEYWIEKHWAVRAGLTLGNENTRLGYASPFSSPPVDLTVTPSVGVGAKFGHWMVDAASAYQFGRGAHVESTVNGFPGDYRARAVSGLLTLRYLY